MDPIQNNNLEPGRLARQHAFGPAVEALGRDIERNEGANFIPFAPPHNMILPPQPFQLAPPIELPLVPPQPFQPIQLQLQRPPPIELPPLPLFPFGQDDDIIRNFPGLGRLDGLRLGGAAGIDELEGLDKELAEMDVELGRMLTWEDIDGYHLHKFITGRTFKNRSYYNSMLEEFYRRIFYAYAEELRHGRAEYNPNIHETETMLYEGQLRRLEELLDEERMERAQERWREEERGRDIMNELIMIQ